MFTALLNKGLQELEKREFESSSTKELLNLIAFFDSQLKSETSSINCVTDSLQLGFIEDLESVKIPLVD